MANDLNNIIYSNILIFSGSDALLNTVLRGLSCFFGGAVAYLVYTKISNFKPTYLLGSLVETILIVSVIFSVQTNMPNKGALCSVLFILTVLFFSFESGIVSKALKNKPFQYLGMLSYSIYMVHSIILIYLGALFEIIEKVLNVQIRVMVDTVEYTTLGSASINNIAVFAIVILVIFISSFTYKYIEVKGQLLNNMYSDRLKSEIAR